MEISEILNISPYSLTKKEKHKLLSAYLFQLTQYHYSKCPEYAGMIDALNFDLNASPDFYNLPFLPVRLFKLLELKSVSNDEVVKTMTSSGTSGQAVSKIFLDKETSTNQTKALTKIVSAFVGTQRVPMIILDSSEVVKNRLMFSARGAGILGFSIFGTKRIYALDEHMNLNIDALVTFIEEYKNERILMFGFTFMVWQHFYNELIKSNHKLNLSNAVLIHGGGWKKLISVAVTSDVFKQKLSDVCGIQKQNIHDYYGMVEQTGSIYMECEYGHLHAPVFSDIIIRRPIDFSIASFGEKGIIQVLSVLPQSYPGHSLLTEDEGVLLGEDDCKCGRLGKYFKIMGRLKNAEIRGCSDTYATKF